MRKHAPLPWTFTANSWQYTTIYDAYNLPVCELDLENWPVTEENQDAFEKEQAKISAFIVKAVNSHDALVEALTKSRQWVEANTAQVRGISAQAAAPGEAMLSEIDAALASIKDDRNA